MRHSGACDGPSDGRAPIPLENLTCLLAPAGNYYYVVGFAAQNEGSLNLSITHHWKEVDGDLFPAMRIHRRSPGISSWTSATMIIVFVMVVLPELVVAADSLRPAVALSPWERGAAACSAFALGTVLTSPIDVSWCPPPPRAMGRMDPEPICGRSRMVSHLGCKN